MDGADRQRQRASALKEEIKRNAVYKREKARVPNKVTTDAVTHQFDVLIPQGPLAIKPTTFAEPNDQRSTLNDSSTKTNEPTLIATLPWSHHQHQRTDTLEQASASELNFVTKYFDFVFPALFPFYQPHIFDSGRAWLLLLLRKNRIAYHAILGLSCYYFTMALSDAEEGTEHAVCKQSRWSEVEKETKQCFDSLRADVTALNLSSGNMSITMMERVDLMNSITHIIVFEMMLGKSAPENTHLPAAFTLFADVMGNAEARSVYRDQPQSRFASVLLGIEDPLWTNPGPSNHIWSPAQAGFRFCAGLLIFIDIIASTAIGKLPRLLHYHSDVLAQVDDGLSHVGDAEIRLSDIVGCPNWAVTAIAEVSAAMTWKRTHSELNQDPGRREAIEHCHSVLAKLGDSIILTQSSLAPSATLNRDYHGYFDPNLLDSAPKPSTSSTVALIWGFAARLYFNTTLNEYRLDDPRVQSDIAQVVGLLRNIRRSQLRTLAWPICVAGCLSMESEESFFIGLLSGSARTHTAGALNDARLIIEKVWQMRLALEDGQLDLTSCFTILGSPILLV